MVMLLMSFENKPFLLHFLFCILSPYTISLPIIFEAGGAAFFILSFFVCGLKCFSYTYFFFGKKTPLASLAHFSWLIPHR
jgi:hypothetical protein